MQKQGLDSTLLTEHLVAGFATQNTSLFLSARNYRDHNDMTRSAKQFQLPEGVTMEQLKTRLGVVYAFREEPLSHFRRVFLETFDWRLYQAGSFLAFTRNGTRGELSWRNCESSVISHCLPTGEIPVFLQDLPEGGFRDELEPVLEMRALLPLVRINSKLHTLRLLDDQEKTIAYLELESGCAVSPDGMRNGDLVGRLSLVPVRGYDADYDRVSNTLKPVLRKARISLYQNALQAIGRIPGDYSSKLNFTLDGQTRCDRATKDILLALLKTLEANIDGAQRNLDSEFLHDLRVATRRTRSALGQIKAVFRPDVVERFKEEFAWLGQVTGQTRDMDVYILALNGYKQQLPPMLREALEPLRGGLTRHHAEEQEILSRHFNSVRFRALLKDWRAFVEMPLPQEAVAANALRPVKEVADERIWKMYRRVLKEGRAIDKTSPAQDLHELRKSCKKLRYLLEFFQSLYTPGRVRALIKTLKLLLDNLGNFQDLEVQAHSLRDLAREVAKEQELDTDTLLAMGALIGNLTRQQQQARDQFAEIFASFDTLKHRKQFKSLVQTEAAG